MNRIALISSSLVSFLSFASPEKGVPNSGMSVLLYEFFRGVGAALKFRCRAKDPVGESKNYFNHCKPDFNILFALTTTTRLFQAKILAGPCAVRRDAAISSRAKPRAPH
jgi:hypothetical protein